MGRESYWWAKTAKGNLVVGSGDVELFYTVGDDVLLEAMCRRAVASMTILGDETIHDLEAKVLETKQRG